MLFDTDVVVLDVTVRLGDKDREALGVVDFVSDHRVENDRL